MLEEINANYWNRNKSLFFAFSDANFERLSQMRFAFETASFLGG